MEKHISFNQNELMSMYRRPPPEQAKQRRAHQPDHLYATTDFPDNFSIDAPLCSAGKIVSRDPAPFPTIAVLLDFLEISRRFPRLPSSYMTRKITIVANYDHVLTKKRTQRASSSICRNVIWNGTPPTTGFGSCHHATNGLRTNTLGAETLYLVMFLFPETEINRYHSHTTPRI